MIQWGYIWYILLYSNTNCKMKIAGYATGCYEAIKYEVVLDLQGGSTLSSSNTLRE